MLILDPWKWYPGQYSEQYASQSVIFAVMFIPFLYLNSGFSSHPNASIRCGIGIVEMTGELPRHLSEKLNFFPKANSPWTVPGEPSDKVFRGYVPFAHFCICGHGRAYGVRPIGLH
jgi:hypothetical protein